MNIDSTDFDYFAGKDDHIWCANEGTIFAKPSSSYDYSSFPSELLARLWMEVAISGDSMKKLPNSEDNDAVRSERVLYDIVSKSISSVVLIIQGMADETPQSAKEYLRKLIDSPNKEKLTNLQSQIDKRSDLSKETISKSTLMHNIQEHCS